MSVAQDRFCNIVLECKFKTQAEYRPCRPFIRIQPIVNQRNRPFLSGTLLFDESGQNRYTLLCISMGQSLPFWSFPGSLTVACRSTAKPCFSRSESLRSGGRSHAENAMIHHLTAIIAQTDQVFPGPDHRDSNTYCSIACTGSIIRSKRYHQKD